MKPNGILNNAGTSFSWPLPKIMEMLIRLRFKKKRYFAVLDLTQGYYQYSLGINSRKYTTFSTTRGSYQWKRVPMGLKGAPSHFQAMMARYVLTNLIYNICDIYIDDIIIYG